MSLDQNWQDQSSQDAPGADAPQRSVTHEPDLGPQPALFQTAPRPLRQRIRRLVIVSLFAFRRALIPAALVGATIFAGSTYMRVESTDAKIALAYTKAEYAQALGQPASVIALVDKRGQRHRLPAARLLQMPHVAALARQTRSVLAQNGLIALMLSGLWLVVSTFRTTRRLL